MQYRRTAKMKQRQAPGALRSKEGIQMKRSLSIIILILAVAFSFGGTVYAQGEHLAGATDWETKVVYNAGSDKYAVEDNFNVETFSDALSGLQPGDDITLSIAVRNVCGKTVDWYLKTEIINSLEDSSEASGGAYVYILKYVGSDGEEQELYNSRTVGGEIGESAGADAPEGLNEVDSALKEYLYLERMETGKEGSVTLYIELDGETQNNNYQNTMADLMMKFATEIVTEKTVITGDSTKSISPIYKIMTASGIVILLLSLDGALSSGKKKKKAKKIASLVVFCLLLAGLSSPVFADTTYQVRVYGGNASSGELKVGDGTVYTETVTIDPENRYGTFTFDLENVKVNDERYFAKGIKEAGEDNSKYMTGEQLIRRDIDYVVVYGMKSTMVEYTVHYVDANGDPLAEPQTFYGNIGDKPVVAFRYFENYQPQAYNLTKTLSEDASENVFTFEYTETVPETIVIVVPGQPGGGQQGGQQQGGQGGQQEGQGGQQGGQDGGQQGGQDGGQQGGQGDNPEPVDIIDIDPPLAPGDKGLPAWAWVGIGAAALGVIAIPIILIVKRRRDDDDEDDDE